MILYNVTIKIDPEIESKWLNWMCNEHIPEVLATGFFTDHKLCKIISMAEEDGITYATQYFCPDMPTFHQYEIKHAPSLRKKADQHFKDKYVAFRTLMEIL